MNSQIQKNIEVRITEIYAEARKLYDAPDNVAIHGFNILYGPPMFRPKLLLISFQGGAANDKPQEGFPKELSYASAEIDRDNNGKENRFGRTMRKYMRETGLEDVLRYHTVATNVILI